MGGFLGAMGASLVRFLFGCPFALLFLAAAWFFTGDKLPAVNAGFALWTAVGAITQVAATALMLMTMERRSFVVTVAYLKTEPVIVRGTSLVWRRVWRRAARAARNNVAGSSSAPCPWV